MSDFVHLHLHTEYSLVDGVVRLRPLVEQVAMIGMPAVAVTDHSNLFGVVKFYRAAEKAGVKPVIGADVLIRNPAEDQTPFRSVLLCQNTDGYRNLARLLTRAQLHGHHHGEALLLYEWLAEYAEGLIVLSGGIHGDVGRALLSGRREGAEERLAWWTRHFPDRYYLELQRTEREFEEDYIDLAVDLAGSHDCPVVATNDVRFVRSDEFGSHEARVCIHDGYVLNDPRRPRLYTEQQYLKSPGEMCELFSDLPEALRNTVEIATRCNVQLQFDQVFLPSFPIPEEETVESYLGRQAAAGLDRKLRAHGTAPGRDLQVYQDRLARELDVIDQMGYPGYFLIVADFVRWAKENEIPVGPGRGSGAGSLVAYALDITGLDPLRYDLLFERFLNPERVSLPDFDIDFCMEGRDRVIEYVAERYGHDRVCQIITLGTMAARAVVRDTGRVLGHPYGFVDRIAKMIPFEIGMTLDKALGMDKELQALYRDDEEVNELIDLALSLEGLARNAGRHAGGVVIAPSTLTDFTPLYCEERGGGVVTQFDKDDVEAIGLVKFDFLGLRTLTIIDWAVKTINKRRKKENENPIDINALPMDDERTFELLRARGTTAVFQLESRGMKDLIRHMQPGNFEDVIALVALFRPGPLQSGMVEDYMDRKHGRSQVEYADPALEPILKPTYGVILYQEQVMQIAQDLAGYSLGGADLLRRAMGKKKPEEMAKQRAIFVKGAEARGVKTRVASYIFDLMEKFAGYGFNKSHSAAYALLAYQTAWLKAHYPAEFMAAVLSGDMDNTDKLVVLVDEIRNMGLSLLSPDINASNYHFQAMDPGTILYGLGAIKGAGRKAVETLVADREANGPYADLLDACVRSDLHKVNRKVFEGLIMAGAFDGLEDNRAALLTQLPEALRVAEQHTRDCRSGQIGLFGGTGGSGDSRTVALPDVPPLETGARLRAERESLGLFLTGHPLDPYREEVRRMISCWISEVPARVTHVAAPRSNGYRRQPEQDCVLAGLIMSARRRGGRMAFGVLDDGTGRVEVALFEKAYAQYAETLESDDILIIEGGIGVDNFSGGYRLNVRRMMSLDEARAEYARRLEIELAPGSDGLVSSLRDILSPYRNGPCPVYLHYDSPGGKLCLALSERWQVRPSEQLTRSLQELDCVTKVQLHY